MFDGISGGVEQVKAGIGRHDDMVVAATSAENAKALVAALVATQKGQYADNQALVDGLLRVLEEQCGLVATILYENIGL